MWEIDRTLHWSATVCVVLGLALFLACGSDETSEGAGSDLSTESAGADISDTPDIADSPDVADAIEEASADMGGDAGEGGDDEGTDPASANCLPLAGLPDPTSYDGFEAEFAALDVDPALASSPWCLTEGNCGVGDPFPGKTHRVYLPSSPSRDDLLVYFPGTHGNCNRGRNLAHLAVAAGYRHICLGYTNEHPMAQFCPDELDPACKEGARAEIAYGEDHNDMLNIERPNSIEGRLVALLAYVAEHRPEAGFDAFLDGNEPRWDRIVLMGFSQGGGHAGFISRDNLVARAIFLSSASGTRIVQGEECTTSATCEQGACVENTCTWQEIVAWAYDTRATPPDREYGFAHEREDGWDRATETFEIYGMDAFGPTANVDTGLPPYGCTHVLSTNAPPAEPGEFHRSMAVDGSMPVDSDGVPINATAYLYLMLAE